MASASRCALSRYPQKIPVIKSFCRRSFACHLLLPIRFSLVRARYRLRGGGGGRRWNNVEEAGDDGDDDDAPTFDHAVRLFNSGDYYTCHDALEELWYSAEEPSRTLLHGILQCAVGFHHLLSQNHRGAMMQLGEGLCKLRKMEFEDGPFLEFEREVAAALEFLYQTQMELAACTEDICLTMDGSERSYQLLGSFGAGQKLYTFDFDRDCVTYIVFSRGGPYGADKNPRVKVPKLNATQEHLMACQ